MAGPPPQFLVLMCIAAGIALHAISLWWTVQRDRTEADACARALGDATPGSEPERWAWRAVPVDRTETRLVLGHDREARHRTLQYPVVRSARHVLFASGRLHLMTDAAFERTLEADDALRDRLGLDPAIPEDDTDIAR